MQLQYDSPLRLATQTALLGMITRSIRAVSLDVHSERSWVLFRVHFDGEHSAFELENMSCVASEIVASFTSGWDIEEQFLTCNSPDKPEYLRLVCYVRFEAC
jgi:hypothetical protein